MPMKMKESEASSLTAKSAMSSEGLLDTILGNGVNVGLSGGPVEYLEPEAPARALVRDTPLLLPSLVCVAGFTVCLSPLAMVGLLASPPLADRCRAASVVAGLKRLADLEVLKWEKPLGLTSNPALMMYTEFEKRGGIISGWQIAKQRKQ
jgi:hypothetical protein